MKKRWVIITAAVLFLLLGVGLLALDRSELYSENFQKKIVSEVARQLHWDLKLEKIKIKPLKGADLENISVSSKDVRPNDFLKANRLRLRYNLWEAILKRHIVLQEFRLDAPSVELDLSPPEIPQPPPLTSPNTSSLDAVGVMNSNNIHTDSTVSTPTPGIAEDAINSLPPAVPHEQKSSKPGTFWPAPQAIDLRKIHIDDGILSLTLPNRQQLFLTGTHIEASLSADPVPTGSGTIICQSSRIAKKVQLAESRCNFLWRADTLSIPKFAAASFNGVIEGSVNADQSKPSAPYDLQLVATNLSLQEIIQTFDEGKRRMWGDLFGDVQTRMRFQGSMLDPIQTSGQGIVQITEARVMDSPALVLVAGLLNRPDLKNFHPQKCEMDFILQAAKLQIPRIEIISPDLQLTGNGWVNLIERTNEFQLKLAMSEELAKRLPNEFVQSIDRRVDGFYEIPFKVWGSNANPQNDLEQHFAKLATRAVGGAIFDKIFQSIKKQTK